MTLESATDQNGLNESAGQFPVRGWRRVFYGAFVVVISSFSFWAAQIIKPEWQSGELRDYLALFFSVEASLVFLVLLAYSILCYLLLLFAPDRFAESFSIRFGIYSGVVFALQYSILLFLYLFDNKYIYAIFLLWLLPIYFPPVYRWLVRRWNAQLVGYLLGILVLVALIIGFAVAQEFLFLVIAALVIAGPFWGFLIALQATLWLLRNHETGFTLPRGLGAGAWLAAYAAAWRYDILKMYELYAELPLVPPNCYIATAAAKGHPHFVGSKIVQLAGGRSLRVNRQLQVFKCAELALMAIAPRLHKILRRIYDLTGKPLARGIQHPFLADAAYLLLKPFEWTAGFILKHIVPEIDSISIYN